MTLTDIRIVGVDVTDQNAALLFYTDALGFRVAMDGTTPAGRWLVVSPPDAAIGIALVDDPTEAGRDTGIRFGTTDAAAAHQELTERGVHVGELLAWDGTPPMFTFDDIDANRYYVVEDWT